MSLIIGIDPGKTGALALLDSYGVLLEVDDMPFVGKQVSASMLSDIITEYTGDPTVMEPPIAVIENVSASPQMGVSSSFNFGRSKGLAEMGVAMAGCRLVYVTPAKWKREMKLTADKGASRQMARERWPDHRDLFKRIKDDGRAEAALIGEWWRVHGEA